MKKAFFTVPMRKGVFPCSPSSSRSRALSLPSVQILCKRARTRNASRGCFELLRTFTSRQYTGTIPAEGWVGGYTNLPECMLSLIFISTSCFSVGGNRIIFILTRNSCKSLKDDGSIRHTFFFFCFVLFFFVRLLFFLLLLAFFFLVGNFSLFSFSSTLSTFFFCFPLPCFCFVSSIVALVAIVQVLTMDFVHGTKITDKEGIEARGMDAVKVAKTVSRTFGEMMYCHG